VRVLVTGGSGFVGTHLVKACLEAGHEVFAVSRSVGRPAATAGLDPRARRVVADIRDEPSLLAALGQARPDRVFHLAGHASVKSSFGSEREIIETNVVGTLNLLRAVREKAPEARVLYVGSAEEYGRSEKMPLSEDMPLRPITPYGVSRASASLVAQRFALAEKLFVVRTRSFNHTGPGQSTDYVAPSLARQLIDARGRGEKRVDVLVGDMTVRRDFSGVSGVVRAYVALLERGASGEVYNVCSGVGIALSDLLTRLGAIVGVTPVAVPDPGRMRPVDVPVLVGNPSKLEAAVGFSIRESLEGDLAGLVAALGR
jgi:GDP-4-dehydro-6-deoxy-D-mannose reductase